MKMIEIYEALRNLGLDHKDALDLAPFIFSNLFEDQTMAVYVPVYLALRKTINPEAAHKQAQRLIDALPDLRA